MSLYAIIKGGIVDGIAIADGPLETDGVWVCVDDVVPQPGPGWLYDGESFTRPVIEIQPMPSVITKLAMIDRFAESEYEGVLIAANTDIQVQGWLDRFAAANQIDLNNDRTISGIDLLVSKDLLTEERGQEILTNPVQPNERP
jgi:hypothetical protein